MWEILCAKGSFRKEINWNLSNSLASLCKFQIRVPQNDTERVVLHAVNQNPNDCRWQSYLN